MVAKVVVRRSPQFPTTPQRKRKQHRKKETIFSKGNFYIDYVLSWHSLQCQWTASITFNRQTPPVTKCARASGHARACTSVWPCDVTIWPCDVATNRHSTGSVNWPHPHKKAQEDPRKVCVCVCVCGGGGGGRIPAGQICITVTVTIQKYSLVISFIV